MEYMPIHKGQERIDFLRNSQEKYLAQIEEKSGDFSEGDHIGRLKARRTSLDKAFANPFELLVVEQELGDNI